MTYPTVHRYLTAHWTVQGADGETGQFGLRIDHTSPVTQALVDACGPIVSAMWMSVGAGIENGYRLSHLRLASIGVDGKYIPGSVSFDHTYSPVPAGGGGTTTARFPLQTALASTLTTAVPRGQANKGRIYLPWFNTALDSAALFPLTQVNTRSAALATMISDLGPVVGNVAVFSKGTVTSTVGAKNNVTGVKTGRRPDVQRRRAKQVTEQYGSTSVVT